MTSDGNSNFKLVINEIYNMDAHSICLGSGLQGLSTHIFRNRTMHLIYFPHSQGTFKSSHLQIPAHLYYLFMELLKAASKPLHRSNILRSYVT